MNNAIGRSNWHLIRSVLFEDMRQDHIEHYVGRVPIYLEKKDFHYCRTSYYYGKVHAYKRCFLRFDKHELVFANPQSTSYPFDEHQGKFVNYVHTTWLSLVDKDLIFKSEEFYEKVPVNLVSTVVSEWEVVHAYDSCYNENGKYRTGSTGIRELNRNVGLMKMMLPIGKSQPIRY